MRLVHSRAGRPSPTVPGTIREFSDSHPSVPRDARSGYGAVSTRWFDCAGERFRPTRLVTDDHRLRLGVLSDPVGTAVPVPNPILLSRSGKFAAFVRFAENRVEGTYPLPRGNRRMTRGRTGLLDLVRTALSSAIYLRLSPALS